MRRTAVMIKKHSFLRIPANRIIALLLIDVMDIIIASFAALSIWFEFSFRAIDRVFLERYESIIIPVILFSLCFFYLWRLYKSVWRSWKTAPMKL